MKGGSAECHFMTRLGNRILYTSDPDSAVSQLWASNGSKSGTMPLTGFSEADQGFPDDFTVDGDRMFFSSGQVENTLWVTDGTRKGTREIPAAGSTPFNLVNGTLRMAGPTLFFANDRRPIRHELWRSDGTPEGTLMIRDAFPAAANGEKPRLDQFTAVGSSVCFFSKTSDSSRLWRSDGTAEGTHLVADVMPGDRSSGPAMLCVAGNRLFFAAEDPVAGYELHVLNLNRDAGMAATVAARSGVTSPVEAGQMTEATPTDETLLRLAFNLDPAGSGRPVLEAGRGTPPGIRASPAPRVPSASSISAAATAAGSTRRDARPRLSPAASPP